MCVSQGLESTTNIWVYFSRVFLQTPSVISSIEKKAKIAGTFSGFVHDISNCSPSKNSKQYFKFCILLLDGCCEGVCFDNSKRPVNMPADESRYPNTCLQECSAYTSKMILIVNEMSTVTKCNDLSFEFTHCSLAIKLSTSLCKTATENTVVATVQSKQKVNG